MAVDYSRERIRLTADAASQDGMLDAITGRTPSIWRGTDLAVEFAAVYGDAGLIDISRFASLTLEVRDATTRTATILATKTIASAEFNPGLTLDQWEGGVSQHGVFSFTKDETRFDLGSALEKDFWLVISGITNDTPTRAVTLGATTLRVVEDGAGETSSSPLPGDPLYLTAEQTRALIGQVIRPTNQPGTTILLVSPSNTWGRLLGVDDQGAPTDTIIRLS